MKQNFIWTLLIFTTTVLFSCKGKDKEIKSDPPPDTPLTNCAPNLSSLKDSLNQRSSILRIDSILSIDSVKHLKQIFYSIAYKDSISTKFLVLQSDAQGGLLCPANVITCVNIGKDQSKICKIVLSTDNPKLDGDLRCPCKDSFQLAAIPLR